MNPTLKEDPAEHLPPFSGLLWLINKISDSLEPDRSLKMPAWLLTVTLACLLSLLAMGLSCPPLPPVCAACTLVVITLHGLFVTQLRLPKVWTVALRLSMVGWFVFGGTYVLTVMIKTLGT